MGLSYKVELESSPEFVDEVQVDSELENSFHKELEKMAQSLK